MSASKPFKGKIRIFADSGLRKLMRAARRNKLPSERLVVIRGAEGSAELRQRKYMNLHALTRAAA